MTQIIYRWSDSVENIMFWSIVASIAKCFIDFQLCNMVCGRTASKLGSSNQCYVVHTFSSVKHAAVHGKTPDQAAGICKMVAIFNKTVAPFVILCSRTLLAGNFSMNSSVRCITICSYSQSLYFTPSGYFYMHDPRIVDITIRSPRSLEEDPPWVAKSFFVSMIFIGFFFCIG